MPAPDLNPQTPGESQATAEQPQAATLPATELDDDQPDEFMVKHNGGKRFIVIDNGGAKVGDFTGSREEAEAEVQRLLDGGEPLELDDPVAAKRPSPGGKDATKLKQPVMTSEGWLCPEPVVKE